MINSVSHSQSYARLSLSNVHSCSHCPFSQLLLSFKHEIIYVLNCTKWYLSMETLSSIHISQPEDQPSAHTAASGKSYLEAKWYISYCDLGIL